MWLNFRRYRALLAPSAVFLTGALLLALLLFSSLAQAGVVIGGTRFVYGEKQQSISVSVRNKSTAPYLLNTKILPGGTWSGADKSAVSRAPFIATPPLFSLPGGRENSIRIIRTGGDLPSDRESLFTLSIAAIPSGKGGPDTVQMAIRSGLKLFYRPAGLKGNPEKAYTQLKWSRTGHQVTVENPTPYYVTLFQLSADGHAVSDAGMVSPFARRTESWCGDSAVCQLRWQSINDYGRVMPVVSLSVSGSTPVAVTDPVKASSASPAKADKPVKSE